MCVCVCVSAFMHNLCASFFFIDFIFIYTSMYNTHRMCAMCMRTVFPRAFVLRVCVCVCVCVYARAVGMCLL